MSHLTELDFIQIIDKGESALLVNKVEHFKKCETCSREYNRQLETHNILTKISPLASPRLLIQKVVHQLELSYPPKQKADWIFLLALIVLFSVAFWYVYSGDISFFSGAYLQGFKEYIPQINKPDMFTALIDRLSLLINSGSKAFFLILGLFAVSIYWIFDKHVHKSIH